MARLGRAGLAMLVEDLEVGLASATMDTCTGLGGTHAWLEKDVEGRFVDNVRRCVPDARIERQAACKLATWPRVGAVDLVVGRANATVGVELKWWGSGSTGRYQTLWDATKLASLTLEQQLTCGYLLSGGTRKSRDLDDAFTRLFDDAEHSTADLAIPAANWWLLPTHAQTTVPAWLITSSIARAQTIIGGVAYELRLARVEPRGAGVFAVPAR